MKAGVLSIEAHIKVNANAVSIDSPLLGATSLCFRIALQRFVA